MKIMRSITRVTLISGAMFLLAAIVSAQDIRYNYLPEGEFMRYKTYSWTDVPGVKYPSQMMDSQIKASIDNQLAGKGLQRVSEGIPDLYIAYQIALDKQTEWHSYGGGGWWWGLGWGLGSMTTVPRTINVGTLVLDFYDIFRKKQVWTGTATKQLNPSKNPDNNRKRLDKAMAKLLKNYPPKSKS